jgi:hypothetical protein
MFVSSPMIQGRQCTSMLIPIVKPIEGDFLFGKISLFGQKKTD